jgi:hypothetical protein
VAEFQSYDQIMRSIGKAKPKRSAKGFAGNLFDDIRDAGIGVVTGGIELGRAGVHDAKDALDGGSHNYRSDDIARAIGSSYKRAYKPLLSGDFKKFGSQFYDHPGNYLLDAATAFTGGGAAVGKLAKVSGRTRPTHTITSRTSGKDLHTRNLSWNPVISGRTKITEAVYSKARPAPDNAGSLRKLEGYFNPDTRGTRLSEKAEYRKAHREDLKATRTVESLIAKLKKDERTALFYTEQGIRGPDRLIQTIKSRRNQLIDDIDEMDRAHILDELKMLESPNIMRRIEVPTPAMQKAGDALHELEQKVTQSKHERAVQRGADPADLSARDIELRTRLLSQHGITPDEGERLTLISHTAPRTLKGKQARQPSGLTDRVLNEDKMSTGRAAESAKYNPDPMNVVRAYRNESKKIQTIDRLRRAAESAVPFDVVENADKFRKGDLVPLTGKDRRLAGELASFIEDKLKPHLDEIGEGYDADEIVQSLRRFTQDESGIERGALALPRGEYNELVNSLQEAKVAKDVAARFTKSWRDVTLSLKGSFYANNFIGNLILSLVAYGPVGTIRGLASAGSKHSALGKKIDEAAPDLARTGAARTERSAAEAAEGIPGLGGMSKAADYVAKKLAMFTEDNFRRGAFHNNLRSMRKETKRSFDELLNDADVVDDLAQATYGDLLDYSKLTPLERDYVRPYLPFWNFFRSMTGRTVRLVADEPWKAEVLANLSSVGRDANEEAYGDLPPYLQGLVSLGDVEGGKGRVLSTYGMNPFNTPADAANQLRTLIDPKVSNDPGGNPLTQLNPVLKVPLEAAMNRDTFLGSEIDPYGQMTLTQKLARQAQMNIPPLAARLKWQTPSVSPSIERDGRETIRNYVAGVNTGTVNLTNVRRQQGLAAKFDALDRQKFLKREARLEAARNNRG